MPQTTSSGAGQCLLLLGAGGLLLGGLQRAGAPVPYFFGDWLILALAFGTLLVGSTWLWQDDHPRTRWRPTQTGRRFQTAVLYTRAGCHLCDEAHSLLVEYGAYLPELAVVDIDPQPELRERFDDCVPVVEFDGQVRFRGEINEHLLQRLLEGTPPVSHR